MPEELLPPGEPAVVAEQPLGAVAGDAGVAAAEPAVAAPGAEWSEDGLDFNGLISEFEDRLILQALSRTGGNKKEAARLLNLKRTTLIEKIKKKNLPV